MTLLSDYNNQRLMYIIWLLGAVVIGLFVATQPLPILITTIALAVFVLTSLITPLAAIMTLVILAPLRTLIATEASFQLPLDIGQLSLVALLGAWVIQRITRQQSLFRFVWSPVYVPLLAFLLTILPGAFFAASTGAWLNEWLKWVQMLVLIVICLAISRDANWQWLLLGLIVAGCANAIVGMYIYFGGSGALHLLINPDESRFRAFGTFGQPNPFGGFMGLLVPLAVTAAYGYVLRQWHVWRITHQLVSKNVVMILFYCGASILLVSGVFISYSRGAWLGFVISMVVMALAIVRTTWQSALLLLLIAIIGATLWFSGRLPASIMARINSAAEEFVAFDDVRGVDITPENYAVVERLAHWQAALNMARENFWFGVGMGNYEVVYDQFRLLYWIFPLGHAHNYYLNIFAEAGIIGLIGYIALWMSIAWIAWQTRKHPDALGRSVAVGILGTLTYLAVHSLTDNLYVNNLFLHLGVMIGILAVLYRQTHRHIIVG